MTRLSREKKREQQQAAVPVDVRVPADGSGEPGASVDGVRVIAGPGEEIQQAVLDRLHRIAVASGHAVIATVRDERIGYVVPLLVAPDGSSRFTDRPTLLRAVQESHQAAGAAPPAPGDPDPDITTARPPAPGPSGSAAPAPSGPVAPDPMRGTAPDLAGSFASDPARTAAWGPARTEAPDPARTPASDPARSAAPDPSRSGASDPTRSSAPDLTGTSAPAPSRPAAPDPTRGPAPDLAGSFAPDPARTAAPAGLSDTSPAPASPSPAPRPQAGDLPTRLLRPAAEDDAPAAAPGPVRDATPTFPLHPVPGAQEPLDSPPTFRLRTVTGPVPPGTPPGTVAPPTGAFGPPPSMEPRPHPDAAAPAPVRGRGAPTDLVLDADPDARPTPPRGFDAVAEAVLGDEPAAPAGSPLAAPLERINDAVRAGRIDTAAGLADETVAQASQTLGAEHPEVLRLRELTAYIAYLGGEPLRAFRLSMDLAAVCRRAGDAEAAYGNVRSAATAWRGVRDPLLGLELGHELTALWTELAAEGGPAADEADELESAHARMDRLTARARDRQT
ncbi:tetratricopeptide repeat protein [Streptomyces sp. NPDC052492]|uniref:tetratricopeptide repeat protein n=1 Tax=Streptomyces sp. NPDC052492 TaxID=3365691 RepID=UPI0037D1A85C